MQDVDGTCSHVVGGPGTLGPDGQGYAAPVGYLASPCNDIAQPIRRAHNQGISRYSDWPEASGTGQGNVAGCYGSLVALNIPLRISKQVKPVTL